MGQLRLIADGGLSYVGESRLTFDGRQQHRMGDYATGRLSLGVEAGSWVATVFVDNLFDTDANTFAYSDPFRLPDAPGRHALASPHHRRRAEMGAAIGGPQRKAALRTGRLSLDIQPGFDLRTAWSVARRRCAVR